MSHYFSGAVHAGIFGSTRRLTLQGGGTITRQSLPTLPGRANRLRWRPTRAARGCSARIPILRHRHRRCEFACPRSLFARAGAARGPANPWRRHFSKRQPSSARQSEGMCAEHKKDGYDLEGSHSGRPSTGRPSATNRTRALGHAGWPEPVAVPWCRPSEK